MSKLYIPEGYRPSLNLKQTQVAIKQVKDFFQRELAAELNLKRVSAPLFVSPDSGLNDNLNNLNNNNALSINCCLSCLSCLYFIQANGENRFCD